MATIADLTVRISAQISEFQKSFNDGSKVVEEFNDDFNKSADSIQKTVDGIANTFSSFGNAVGTIGIAVAGVTIAADAFSSAFNAVSAVVKSIAGTITDAVTHTANLGDELFALSQKTGLSVESLSGFKFVAAQTNTSLDSITGAVFKLETNLGSSAKKTVAALKEMGLSLTDLRKADPADAFTQIIAKLGEIPNASARAAAGVDIFSKSFKGIAQLTQEDLPALTKQAKELGLVMSTETAVAADRLKDAFGVLHGAGQGLQEQLGARLLPGLVALTEVLGGVLLDALKTAGFGGVKFGEVFDTVVVQIGKGAIRLVEVFALMAKSVVEWAAVSIGRFSDEANAFITLAETIVSAVKLVDIAQNGGQGGGALDAIQAKLEGARSAISGLAETAKTAGTSISAFSKGIADAASSAGDNFSATYRRIQGEIEAAADKMRARLRAIGDGGAEGAARGSDAFKSFEKQLADLTAQIDRAAKNGTPLAQLVKLFGDEAAKATPRAQAWGIAVKTSVDEVSRAFNAIAKDKTFDKLDDGLQKFGDTLAKTQFKKFQADMHESAVAILEWSKQIKKGQDAIEDLGAALAKKQFEKLAASIHEQTPQVVAELTNPFKQAFAELAQTLPDLIARGVKENGVVGAFVGLAQGASEVFGKVFTEGMSRTLGDFSKLTGKEKLAGVGALAANAFVSGFASGLQGNSDRVGSAVLAFGSSFLAGFTASAGNPYVGLAVGLVGLAGNLIGASKDADIAAAQLANSQKDLVRQFGGSRDEFQKLADKIGFGLKTDLFGKKSTLSPERSVAVILNPELHPEQFNNAVGQLNDALAAYEKKLKAIDSATAAVNQRTNLFAKQFAPLVTAKANAAAGGDTDGVAAAGQAIQELAQRTQPEFERLGLFVKDTFSAIVKESGSAVNALIALAPAFQTLKSGVTDFGLQSTSVIDGLLSSFDILNNQDFAPFFANIEASGQIVKSLFDANALSPESFQAAAADIGQSIQEIINRGGDLAKTLALSQPQLQALWEEQQTFGGVTDQTTQSILAQAAAQGLVGEQFKSTQEKVLDVLLAIADVFHAAIPDGIRATAAAAETAGGTIRDSFGSAATDAAESIDVMIGGSLRKIIIPAGEAGDEMRKALETQAAEAARSISGSLGGAFVDSASKVDLTIGASMRGLDGASKDVAGKIYGNYADCFRRSGDLVDPSLGQKQRDLLGTSAQTADGIFGNYSNCFRRAGTTIDGELGGKMRGLVTTARDTTNDINGEFSRLRVPDLRARVSFDVDGIHPLSGVPALATGGIVRRPTLALIGEAGPEAIVPLSRGGLGGAAVTRKPAPAVVFHKGSVVINGNVRNREDAEFIVRQFSEAVRKDGKSRELARQSLGVD